MAAFREKCVSFNTGMKGSLIADTEAFNNLKLKTTVEDKYFHIMKLGKKLQKSSLYLLNNFIDELPTQLQFFVRAGRPANIDEALQSARVGKSVGYGGFASASGISGCNAVSIPAHNSTLQDQINDLALKMTSLTEMFKHPAQTPQQQFTGQQRSVVNNRHICFNCRGSGLCRKESKWTGATSSQPDAQCQLCSQFGHIASDCALHCSRTPLPVNQRGSGATGRGQLKRATKASSP